MVELPLNMAYNPTYNASDAVEIFVFWIQIGIQVLNIAILYKRTDVNIFSL